jgi:hypothetical protein
VRVASFSFEIDPHVVLEIPPGAPLQVIRDAYRQQAKRFHPDTGGTDWTFRLLAQAYEVLCTERVARAAESEAGQHGRSAGTDGGPFGPQPASDRPGPTDPALVVGIEKLAVRYEAEPLWLMQGASREEQCLSYSINFKWPDPSNPSAAAGLADVLPLLGRLTEVFEVMCLQTKVATSRIRVGERSFSGWLSYNSVERAATASRRLLELLDAGGFGVKQWNRDMVIPRTWG